MEVWRGCDARAVAQEESTGRVGAHLLRRLRQSRHHQHPHSSLQVTEKLIERKFWIAPTCRGSPKRTGLYSPTRVTEPRLVEMGSSHPTQWLELGRSVDRSIAQLESLIRSLPLPVLYLGSNATYCSAPALEIEVKD